MTLPLRSDFGSWKSPLKTEMLVSGSIRFIETALHEAGEYWIESRPREEGRNVIVMRSREGKVSDLLPPPWSARTRVHEYGGGGFLVSEAGTFFSNFSDQRIYRLREGMDPEPIGGEEKCRYADYIFDAGRNRLIGIREDHREEKKEAANGIAAISLGVSREEVLLLEGNDFYSSPRLSPDGRKLAWLTWNRPNMPWDGTELWIAELKEDGSPGKKRRVAGGEEESIVQPEWSPDGILYFVSDCSNWWNIYREKDGEIEAVLEMEAEFAGPQWVFGPSHYGFLSSSEILSSYARGGRWKMGRIMVDSPPMETCNLPFTHIGSLRVGKGKAILEAASPTLSPSLVEWFPDSGEYRVIRESNPVSPLRGYTSIPEPIAFPTAGNQTAHGFFYPPANKDFEGPDGELPPLMVIIHGGPTAATEAVFSLRIQFWTTRGFGVFDINYGGSSGYGREYRNRLKGNWGIVDVKDCVHGVRHLANLGKTDPEKTIIKGGSAGGFTALAALAFDDTFKAGVSYYGVTDLEALTRETHKFESRYLDQLIGPYPEHRSLYRERSPLRQAERITQPVLFLQGLEDPIVPPDQAEQMVEALEEKGIPVAYLAFPGEQHGFRKSKTIIRAHEAELYFYSRIFGFALPEKIEPIEIHNLEDGK